MTARIARTLVLLALVAGSAPASAGGQEAAAPSRPPAAAPADVASVDAVLAAVYDVISGPAGAERRWERFRSLFLPGAHLIPTGGSEEGGYRNGLLTPDEYIDRAGPQLVANGFFEREIHRVTERYGPVVHAFSTYESRRAADDAEPFARGINSFQLFWDGERWWVANIFWFGETEEHPIPAGYLPGG